MNTFILKFDVEDFFFRLSLSIIFVIFVFIWCRSLIKSGIKVENIFSSQEGFIDGFLLRIFISMGIVGILLYIVNPEWMNWSHIQCPPWIRVIGLPLGLIAVYLLYWTLKSLGRNFSPTLRIRENQTLVIRGPYRWVRHPMYTIFVILWLAYLLLSANWFIGFTGLSAYGLIIVKRTPKEERMMVDRFGEKYIAYMKRTGRFLPRLKYRQ